MTVPKLVIWDLDETLVDGVFVEGDHHLHPAAIALIEAFDERGVIQALATQNDSDTMQQALSHFGWANTFVSSRASFGPKNDKIHDILAEVDIDVRHAAFIDEDPFERDSIAVQIPGLETWSIADAEAAVSRDSGSMTDEARRRPEMYREMHARSEGEASSVDYEAFLVSCDLRILVRPYVPGDADRVIELLRRTNRMNLGRTMDPNVLLDAVTPHGPNRILIAELEDRYGHSGRVGVIRLTADESGADLMETCAISCRTRARGLALALLVGMLRHPSSQAERIRCQFQATGQNRPLRMLLWAAGFKASETDDLLEVSRTVIQTLEPPQWATVQHLEGGGADRSSAARDAGADT